MENFTAHEIKHINDINTKTEDMELGTKLQTMVTELTTAQGDIDVIELALPILRSDLDAVMGDFPFLVEGTPTNAKAASKTLTISGVVIDGETVTINNPAVAGTDVYEFLTDVAQTKTSEANIAVNIEASAVKAFGTLTVDTQPTSADTMTIGSKVFTFVPNGTDTADGEISVGTDLASAKAAIVAAINGTDVFNDPHPLVTAAAFGVADACVITALVGGTVGNTIVTTETFDASTNIFAAGVLGSGANCSAANAVTALVSAIEANDSQDVGSADGAGDTVVLTADDVGVAGNSIIIAEAMANGAFAGGATLLSGGQAGTVGLKGETKIDSSYLYKCIENNTITDDHWRRISLGSAY